LFDLTLDVIVAVLPAVIAFLSVVVGVKLAKNPADESHRPLWWTIVGLSIALVGFTPWQQAQARRAHEAESSSLQSEIRELKGQVTESKGQTLELFGTTFQRLDWIVNTSKSEAQKEAASAVKKALAPQLS